MKTRFFIRQVSASLMALAIAHFICPRAAAAQVAIVSFSFIDGRYTVSVNEETAKSVPAWKPGDGEPPVSPGQAIKAADRVFQANYDPKQHPDWTISLSRLELIPCENQVADDDMWIWFAVYEPTWKGLAIHDWGTQAVFSGGLGDTPLYLVPVLMNGRAVTPVLTRKRHYSEAELREMASIAADFAQPGPTGPWLYRETYLQDSQATVTAEMLKQTPDWSLSKSGPPASFATAFTAASPVSRRWLPSDDLFRTTLESAGLRELQKNKWVWRFYFERKVRIGGSTGPTPYIEVAVLMDGKAVEPMKVEQDK